MCLTMSGEGEADPHTPWAAAGLWGREGKIETAQETCATLVGAFKRTRSDLDTQLHCNDAQGWDYSAGAHSLTTDG